MNKIQNEMSGKWIRDEFEMNKRWLCDDWNMTVRWLIKIKDCLCYRNIAYFMCFDYEMTGDD